ncbi:hypothetical protein ABZO31_18945 [Streptomyces sp. HUAS MG47]|uniref:hypothetical protein n=1 Tax=Streptomyces solicamelliae TaxID=3231716 RepID=UPI003877E4C1
MTTPGPHAPTPHTPTRTRLAALALLAAAVAAAAAAVTATAAARRRREKTPHPLDRIWHPQESVALTPAEEEAFDNVVAHLTHKAKH